MRSTCDLSAPLPLGYARAVQKAIELKADGLIWRDVAYVMRVYHGVDRMPGTWRVICRRAGRTPTPHKGQGSRNLIPGGVR